MIRKPLILLFFLATTVLYGQPGDPGDDVDGEVPIPGIGILLAAGAAFGAKKAYDVYRRREK